MPAASGLSRTRSPINPLDRYAGSSLRLAPLTIEGLMGLDMLLQRTNMASATFMSRNMLRTERQRTHQGRPVYGTELNVLRVAGHVFLDKGCVRSVVAWLTAIMGSIIPQSGGTNAILLSHLNRRHSL